MREIHHILSTLPAILAACALFSGCVDNRWDMSQINTDGIVVGDHVTIPLGRIKMSDNDIINVEGIEEVQTDDNGDYMVIYEGGTSLFMDDKLALDKSFINDLTIAASELKGWDIENWPINDGRNVADEVNYTSEEKESDIDLRFTGDAKVKRIDRIVFNTDDGNSRVKLNIGIEGLLVGSAEQSELTVVFKLPRGLNVTPLSEGLTGGAGTLTYNFPLDRLDDYYEASSDRFNLDIEFALNEYTLGADDKIGITSSIKLKECYVERTDDSPSFKISARIVRPTFEVIYGEIEASLSAPAETINTIGLDILFSQGNNLSFHDPRILLTTLSNVGLPIDANFLFSASGCDDQQISLSLDAPIRLGDTQTNNIWLGGREEAMTGGYVFRSFAGLQQMIRGVPPTINMDVALLSVSRDGAPMFLPGTSMGPFINIGYRIEIPLAPAADFRATIDQKIYDVFTDDIIESIFADGLVELSGTVENTLPLNFGMEVIISDDAFHSIGIEIPAQHIKGCQSGAAASSQISLLIPESDMNKMKLARTILIRLTATSDEELAGRCLNTGQSIEIQLGIRKAGGIKLDALTDD